jgi:MoxR-like ATPase
MEEKSVSIDGETHKLPEPFFVIATQNPMDSSGTSSLPDSQLDRFMISYSLSDLNENEKVDMLKNGYDLSSIKSDPINWEDLQTRKSKVKVNDEIYKYVIEIEETIKSLDQHIHVSARCLKQIIDLAKGWAVVHGKDYVTHQEVKDILPYIFRHRIKFIKQEDKFNYVNQEILSKISIQK